MGGPTLPQDERRTVTRKRQEADVQATGESVKWPEKTGLPDRDLALLKSLRVRNNFTVYTG
jgi:hypothetical protein